MDRSEQADISLAPVFGSEGFTCGDNFAHDCDLAKPGDYITGYAADQAIFAVRGDDGEVRAFYNVCQHRGHRLLEDGCGTKPHHLVYPYHAWPYDLGGRLRHARGAERAPACADIALKEIRIQRLAGLWFVNLDPNAADLEETARGLAGQILGKAPDLPAFQALCQGTFSIDGNWKVCIESSLECYHCRPAHPGCWMAVSKRHGCCTRHRSFERPTIRTDR